MLNRYFSFIFQSLLADEQLASAPILILGNKIDKPEAVGEDYIRQYFGLYGITTGRVSFRVLLLAFDVCSVSLLSLEIVLYLIMYTHAVNFNLFI